LKALRQEVDERILVEAAQQDPRRFAELYELHFHRVYAYVMRRVQGREEAEDVTSDVFHQALAKIKDFEWRGVPFSAWLIRIAANAMADRWKRMQREGNQPMPDDLVDTNTHGEDMEQQAALFQLVESLPADSAPGGPATLCRAKKHPRDRAGNSSYRRSGKTVAISRPTEAADADRGCRWLSALPSNNSIKLSKTC
jgi:Sigma-70 region 2